MSKIFQMEINNDQTNNTIKQIMVNYYGMSSRLISNIKKEGEILLNESPVFVNVKVNRGDILKITLPHEYSTNIIPSKIPLEIKFEDEDILVLNKPAGIYVHPCQGSYDNTLANGVVYHWNKNKEIHIFRPVSRLDKDTSGLIIIAKNQYAHHKLSLQMDRKILQRRYIGIINGHLNNKKGIIKLPIKRKKGSIIERCISNNGVDAVTKYKVLKNINDFQIVEFELETGRTHQIRVHMSYLCTPLIGDWLYGRKDKIIQRHALHAYSLSFIHPYTQKKLTFYSKLPLDMLNIVKSF